MDAYRVPFVASVVLHFLLAICAGGWGQASFEPGMEQSSLPPQFSLTLSDAIVAETVCDEGSEMQPDTKKENAQAPERIPDTSKAADTLPEDKIDRENVADALPEDNIDRENVADALLYGMGPTSASKGRSASPPPVRADAGSSTLPSPCRSPVEIVSMPKPLYPRRCRRRGNEGRVIVEVTVLSSGKMGNIQILESSGISLLDKAAVTAVKQGRFRAATILGVPVTAKKTLAFTFNLDS